MLWPMNTSIEMISRTAQSASLRGRALSSPSRAQRLRAIGVVGAGLRSAAIARRLADHGFDVTFHAPTQQALDVALAHLGPTRAAQIEPTCWYVGLSEVDAVVVCEEECADALPDMLANLERVMKNSEAVLRTPAASTAEQVARLLIDGHWLERQAALPL